MVINYDKILKAYDENCRRVQKTAILGKIENVQEKSLRMKRLEADYLQWFAYHFPHYATCKPAPFHRKIAQLMIKHPVIKLLNDAFRGSAKSVHLVLGIPLYLTLVKRELWFLLLIGATEEKAIQLLADIQAELKTNDRLIHDYGYQVRQGDWAEGAFTTQHGVHFHALGFGQDPRGLHNGEHRPDYIVCDDIDTLKRCNNDRLIREAVDYITGTLWGCFDKGHERFAFANNLIHKNSIMAKLIELSRIANKQAIEKGIAKTFFHIKTPAVTDDQFTPSWPGKYTAEYWIEKRATTPYRSWMREYMCTPLADGAIFNPEWVQYKKMLPLSRYDALVVYGDLSYKDKGDYKAMMLVGKWGREFHLIDTFVRQTSRSSCAVWLYDLYERCNLQRYNIAYYIEGLFAQDEFVGDFDQEGDIRGYYIPVVADKKPKENKYDRIESMVGHFERRNVYFNTDRKDSSDFTALEDQLYAFEKGSGANDDAPDALQSAIAKLNRATFVAQADSIVIIPRRISDNRH